MRTLGRRSVRVAAIVSLLALLLVPLALSRHQHGHPGSQACAICIAAHHSPCVAAASPVVHALLVASIRPAPPPLLVPARPDRSSHTGRAPPHAPSPALA